MNGLITRTMKENSIIKMQQKLIATGAESQIFLQENLVAKRRIKKSYRIAEIDEKLRKLRTRSEGKIMDKLSGIINIPKIIKVDEKSKEIIMEFIDGKKLSDYLDTFSLNQQEEICREIGKETGEIHDLNIIHGDLTTSNMILAENPTNKCLNNKKIGNNNCPDTQKSFVINNKDNSNAKIFFIDFGLSFHSSRIEDKAVDLHLLRQALESRHFKHWNILFNKVIEAYNPQDKEKILKQLEKVEKRGRYKH